MAYDAAALQYKGSKAVVNFPHTISRHSADCKKFSKGPDTYTGLSGFRGVYALSSGKWLASIR